METLLSADRKPSAVALGTKSRRRDLSPGRGEQEGKIDMRIDGDLLLESLGAKAKLSMQDLFTAAQTAFTKRLYYKSQAGPAPPLPYEEPIEEPEPPEEPEPAPDFSKIYPKAQK